MHDTRHLVLSEDQIQCKVKELAEILSRDYAEKRPMLIGVLKGAFRFLADLTRHLTIPVDIEFVRISSYGMNSASCGKIHLIGDVCMSLKDRHVIIVEDIVDSGITLEWLVRELNSRGPASLKICALIDKLERREHSLSLDYVGFTIKEGFLVGYGLDYAEQYRYLNAVYHLAPD